jgi:hypothetical protein
MRGGNRLMCYRKPGEQGRGGEREGEWQRLQQHGEWKLPAAGTQGLRLYPKGKALRVFQSAWKAPCACLLLNMAYFV